MSEFISDKKRKYSIIEEGERVLVSDSQKKEYELKKAEGNVPALQALSNMIQMSEYILAPIDTYTKDDDFYYITGKIGKGFQPLKRYLMNAEKYVNIPFSNICDIALNLVDNFQILHYYNLVYSNCTDDDIFINIKNGQVQFLGEKLIKMDSEMITDRALEFYEDADSEAGFVADRFLMFTLLFKLFYLHHPMNFDGQRMNGYVFSSLVKAGDTQFTNATLYRELYPTYINQLFDTFFLKMSTVSEIDAKEAILKLKYSITSCTVDGCRAENFYEPNKELKCWRCGQYICPVTLEIIGGSNNTIVLTEGCTISRNDIFHDGAFNKFIGQVVRNPKDRSIFGIKNLLDTDISFAKVDGTIVDLQPNQAAPIAEGITIYFAENIMGKIGLANITTMQAVNLLESSEKKTSVSIFRRDDSVVAWKIEEDHDEIF